MVPVALGYFLQNYRNKLAKNKYLLVNVYLMFLTETFNLLILELK